MAKPRKGRKIYTIPKGSKAVECDGHKTPGGSCRRAIYFVRLEHGNRHPIDPDPQYGGRAPTDTEDGVGVSHFGTCPDAQRFAGARK